MQVRNMISSRGNLVANQFIVEDVSIEYVSKTGEHISLPRGGMFQSYESNIAFITHSGDTFLDEKFWDFSTTTGKYRNQFLGESKKDTLAKIKSGEYILTNLNG